MPTPNWGPQNGVPMDDATFDAYVVSNPPDGSAANPSRPVSGGTTGTILDNSAATGGASYDPSQYVPPGGGPGAQGAQYWEDFYSRGPASVQMPQFQTANQDQARLQQEQVIQALQTAARGDPNSMAQQQLQQGYGAAQSQQSSLGSTMRGQSAGAGMRGIQAGQQGIQRGLAGDQQMLMVQEQQAAQSMLAQLLAQQQGQDISQATSMAQGVNQGNSMDEAMRQFYAQGGLEAGLNRETIGRDNRLATLGINQGYTNLALQTGKNVTNAGAGLAGAFATQGGGQQKTSQQTIDDAFYGGG